MTPKLKEAIKLDPDAIEEAYKRGFDSGKEHSKSSPETKKRLKQVEDNVAEHKRMMEQLQKFTDSFQQLLDHSKERDIKVDEIVNKIEAMVAKVDEMYTVYSNGGVIVWFLKYLFGAIVAIGGAYILFKKVFLGIYS